MLPWRNGRRPGLKIQCPAMGVRVRVPGVAPSSVKLRYIYKDALWNSCENQFLINEPRIAGN